MSPGGEHDRILGNVLLLGVIAELDVATARAKVDADGMLTDWLPWMTSRAGANRDWHPPEVGAQVIVACPFGDPSQGVVLGSIYQTAFPAPANLATVDRAVFEDGTVVEYDRELHRLNVDVGEGSVVINCKTATIVASELITLDTPEVHATGKITAVGDITTPAEVKAGDIGLKTHHHTEQGDSAPTSAAQT